VEIPAATKSEELQRMANRYNGWIWNLFLNPLYRAIRWNNQEDTRLAQKFRKKSLHALRAGSE